MEPGLQEGSIEEQSDNSFCVRFPRGALTFQCIVAETSEAKLEICKAWMLSRHQSEAAAIDDSPDCRQYFFGPSIIGSHRQSAGCR